MNTGDMDRLELELIAYLEGELSPEARNRVQQRLNSDPDYRAELDWLQAAYADLEAAENSATLESPPIDIVDPVMRAVQKIATPSTPIPLESARASRGPWLKFALAAAALIAVYIGYDRWKDAREPGEAKGPTIARTPDPTPTVEPVTPDPKSYLPENLARQIEKLDQTRDNVHRRIGATPEVMEATTEPRIELPTSVAEVAAARREISGGATMDKLMQWASLSKTKALEIASAPEASPQVMVGAAESLGGEDARRILLTAVGRLPEDPASRLQLAKVIDETAPADPAQSAENTEQAVAQLDDVKNIDPGNSLPLYFEAKMRLEENDPESALQLLEAAANMGKASAYSLESAIAEAEALIAGGMDPDAARLVAALTAGAEENKFLCQLASDLLDYGQVFLSANDTQTAENIFRAVEQMGRQVEEGATFSQEQLAGMDIQAQALDAMGALFATIESADGVTAVTASMEALTGRIQELDTFFSALDTLFLSSLTEEFWNQISNLILSSGDLTLLNQLSVPTPTTP